MPAQYDDAIMIDSLVVAKFSRAVFEDMHKGGITAANCTCSIWHDFRATMANIAQWKHWFEEHADLITQDHPEDERAGRRVAPGERLLARLPTRH